MIQRFAILRVFFGFALVSVASLWAIAANSGQNYGRLNFAFSEPARLKTSVNGTTAVLSFTSPVVESPAAIKATLPAYVNAVKISPDKKQVTLTLAKPYRLRQFVSGTHVGVDLLPTDEKPLILGDTSQAATEVKAESPILTTAKPAKEKPPEKNTVEKKKPPEVALAKPAEKPKQPPVKNAASAKVVAATTVATAVPKAEDPMLSTKTATPAPEQPAEAMLTTKPAQVAPAPAEATPEPADTAPSPPVEAMAEAAEPLPTKAAEPLLITAHTANAETTLNFPWKARTAAAVFERGQDIWVVFSRPTHVNPAMLRSVLPRQVINLTQYAVAGNTVLRLTTDGSLHARAEQTKNAYDWNIALGKAPAPPALDTAITADSLEGTMRLMLAVFDVAPAVRFFDPTAGDELIILPAFENGRGVSAERRFVELDILPSPQGVALVNRQPALTTSQTRAGFILGTAFGLSISESLPKVSGSKPITAASLPAGVMMPYDQWYVPPDVLLETISERLQAVANATQATKANALMELTKVYLAEGYGAEAAGLLLNIKTQFPDYYVEHKLALLSAAAHIMQYRPHEAGQDLLAPELNDLEEAALWREVVALHVAPPPVHSVESTQPTSGTDAAANTPASAEVAAAPAPTAPVVAQEKPVFHFLKYNKSFIRFYPPRIRQRLANLAADAYLEDGQEEKALATYDTLMKDNVLDPVAADAEFALGKVAQKKGEFDQALEIFSRLSKQPVERRIATRARHALAVLLYGKAKITNEETVEMLELARTSWRGDTVEREILGSLMDLHTEAKRYDDLLRTQKAMLEGFPSAPDAIQLSGDMGELFARVFNDGLADEMPPLKALSLFYEFRDLTPLGEQGDLMIQHLANRLAAVDLLDRATQLLEHQIKFRATAEQRSQIGARLALLYLLNQQPQEALSVLEVTNYGTNSPELTTQRQQLSAQALNKLGKNEEALGVLFNDRTQAGARLRLDVLWAMQDWPNVINHAEELLAARTNLTDPLSNEDTETLLKLSLAYCFEGDYVQLRYLRDYYSALIPDSAYKQIFDFITNDTTPLDPEDFALLAKQINRTEGFLGTFKEKIAAGKLSEALQ